MSRTPSPVFKPKADLTAGPVSAHLIRMTIPMIWGMFAVIFVQLADTYFISLMNDTHILAGISFTFPVTMIISHLVFGLNIAMSSVVSRLIGARDIDNMRRVVLHGILLAVAASTILAFLIWVFMKPLFMLMGADELTYPAIADYMPLWLVASIIMAIPVNANSAMRAGGDTVDPALIMSFLAVINFILNPILIFGYLGFPALGVTGSALATLIAYILTAVLALYIVAGRKHMLALDGLHLDKLRDSMRRLLVIAIPAGIANIIMPLTYAIIIALLAEYGSGAVAAFGVVTRIEAFAMLFVIALAIGMAPIIGQNWGAQHYARVHKTINLAMILNLAWSALAALILGVFAHPIAAAFSNDPEVIHYAAMFLWIVPFSYGIGNLVYGWSSSFNAMGKPQRAFVMIFTKAMVLLIPAVWIGKTFYGVAGIFWAMAIINVLSGLVFHFLSQHYCQSEERQRLEASQPQ